MNRVRSVAAVAVFVIMALSSQLLPARRCAAAVVSPEGESRVIIVDTDMGLDDARAIFALLGSRGIEIAAFCTVEGSASAVKASDNLIGLIESAGSAPVTVYRGFPGKTKRASRSGDHTPRDSAAIPSLPRGLSLPVRSPAPLPARTCCGGVYGWPWGR